MTTEITNLRLDKICRLCLGEGDLRSIYSYTVSNVICQNVCLLDMLTFCISLEATETDGLPSQICPKCLEEVCKYYNFKQQCKKSEDTLKDYIVKVAESEIKTEASDSENLFVKDEFEKSPSNRISKKCSVARKRRTLDKQESEDFGDTNWSDHSWEVDDAVTSKEVKKRKRTSGVKGPPFTCKRCDLTFESQDELTTHRSTTRHPRPRNHRCPHPGCGKSFTRSQLTQHQRTHTRERPFRCAECGARFSLNCNLRRHAMIHSGERPHRCAVCGRGFIQSTSLQEHVRTHSGDTPFVCSVCGRRFTQAGQLRMHAKRHADAATGDSSQPQPPQHHCSICNRSFHTKSILKTHQLIHGEKKFLCSDCGRGFVSMAGLQSHSKVHTGLKPYSCDICTKSFSQIGSLKAHNLIHTGQKPYVCEICSRAFTQRNHLNYHMFTHTGEKKYGCTVCGKRFSLNGTLTVHMRTHTGETPYLCPVCGKGFYDSSSMKKHKRGHGEASEESK